MRNRARNWVSFRGKILKDSLDDMSIEEVVSGMGS